MKKGKRIIYSILTALMVVTLLLPIGNGTVNAAENDVSGSLTIHKFEQDPTKEESPGEHGDGSELTNPPAGQSLEGVTYQLTQTHIYHPATDKWSATSSGHEFTETTDSNGEINLNFSGDELGRYTVQEIDGPDNVHLNPDAFQVDIPLTNEDGSNLNYHVHVYPKNETVRGDVEVHKYDGKTEAQLEGVQFQLFHADGTPYLDEDRNEVIVTTDANGIVSIDNLPYGDYYLQEIETIDGYLVNGEKLTFTIDAETSEQGVSLYLANFEKPTIEKTVDQSETNRGETVTFTLSVDLPYDINDYTEFVVTDDLDDNLTYVDGSENSASFFNFEQDGQKLTWTIDDFSAVEYGDGIATITFDAIITGDAAANQPIENEGIIDFDNGYDSDSDRDTTTVTPTAGSLKVIKQDGDNTDKKLAGAEFELTGADGFSVNGTTNEDGEIDFGELDFGDYTLTETKAPSGYSKLNNPIDITINGDNQFQIIEIDNYESSDWELPKTGGMGTLFFTLIGLTFMGSALVMYYRRRKGESA